MADPSLPPAIIVDGSQNALSAARSLGRRGVRVYTLCRPDRAVRASRHVRWLPMPDGGSPRSWERFLLGADSDHLAGAVLLAASDEAISLIAGNAGMLAAKFRIEECDPALRLDLLDKFRTYELARAAGIPTVGFAAIESLAQAAAAAARFTFPVIVKPSYSPDADRIGSKFLFAADPPALLEKLRALIAIGAPSVVMEFVPGGDDLLCSYYAYMDEAQRPLAECTKRLRRRYPEHTGIATYHVMTEDAEVAELGRRFFRAIGLRGIGNVEFKRDRRDGQLKIIEANLRFTAADCIIAGSGVDLAAIAYARATGTPLPPPRRYRNGRVLWLPLEDVRAVAALRRARRLSLLRWLGELVAVRQTPYLSLADPLPFLFHNTQRLRALPALLRRAPRRAAAAAVKGGAP